MINKIKQFFRNLPNKLNPRKRSELFQRSLKNASFSSADYLVLPVLWLIATPFFVSRLGTDEYGIWMLVNSFLGFSGLVAFGLGDATIKYVSKYRALEDSKGVVRVVRSTLTMYFILGTLTAIGSYFLAPLLVNHVFNVEPENVSLAITALRIGGIGIAARFLDSVFQSTIYGYERYDLAAKVRMVVNIVTVGVNVLLVASGYSVVEILLATIGILVLSGAAKAIVSKYLLIKELIFLPTINRKALKEIFSFGFYSWLQGIGGILLGQVDRILIVSLLNTSALTYYTVCLQLAQQIHALLSKAVSFLFPLSSAAKETGDLDRMRRIYFKGINFTTTAGVAIGLPIFLFSHNILSLWMRVEFANEAAAVLRVLAFVFTLLAAGSILPYYYMNGTGFVRLNTFLGMISGAIVTIASLLLIPWLGILGAALARVANLPIGVLGRTIVHYKVLSDRRWYTGLTVIIPVLASFAVSIGISKLFGEASFNLVPLILMSSAFAILGAIIASIFCYLFNYPSRLLA